MSAGNFTAEIKREILRDGFENTCCKTAALSAFLRATGSIIRSGSLVGFEFVTENEEIAEYMVGLLEDIYGAELNVVQAVQDARNGKNRLAFRCLSERSLFILSELGIAERAGEEIALSFDIDKYLTENECCKRAYIKGAFLGSGSCSVPKEENARSGYHLEIVFSSGTVAAAFLGLLEHFDVLAKNVLRKGTSVVYLKSRESISDFLDLIGAKNSLQKLDKLAWEKDERNNINRVANCMQKNFDRTAIASVRQVCAIERIAAADGLGELDPVLRETAEARLMDKEASLKELSERLHISKSCLNHRLRRLEKIARSYPEEE